MPNSKSTFCFISLILLFSCLVFPCISLADDNITISTYYPSPYGVYKEMRAQRIAIGDNYIDNTVYCWEGTCTNTINSADDLVVEGNVGIGTTAPLGKLIIQGAGTTTGIGLQTMDSSGTALITTLDNGRVGIGTTSPGFPLHIKGTISAGGGQLYIKDAGSVYGGILMQGNNTSGGGLYITYGSDGTAAQFYRHPDAATIATTDGIPMYISSGSAGYIYIPASSGYIGINTTSTAATLTVNGSVSKTSGSFDIPNPDPAKEKQGWRLRHSFVESPSRGDNLYRWTVNVVNKTALISLPDYFKYLNENVQIWVSPDKHFGRAFGEVDAKLTKITITADSDGRYNVLAVSTRKDHLAKEFFDPKGVEYQQKK